MSGARHFTELVVWQVGDAMRERVYALTRKRAFASDIRPRRQVEDAVESICRNIAEGFGCGSHPEFLRFLVYARRSANELMDSLRSARLKGHIGEVELNEIQALARRFSPALGGLMRHLARPSIQATGRRPATRRHARR